MERWRGMMQQPAGQRTVSIGGLVANVDFAATSQKHWASCECEACVHYRKHATAGLSPSFCRLLAEFGLAPDSAAYSTVTDAFPERKQVRFEGHFVVFGELLGGERTPDFDPGQGCVFWLDRAAWTGGMYDQTYSVPHLDEPHFFIKFKALFPGQVSEEPDDLG